MEDNSKLHNYIFYTPEGCCTAPNCDEVFNFQVLGFAKGETRDDAIKELLADNCWIDEKGYDHNEFISRELL